jgi:hypothetical protein
VADGKKNEINAIDSSQAEQMRKLKNYALFCLDFLVAVAARGVRIAGNPWHFKMTKVPKKNPPGSRRVCRIKAGLTGRHRVV